MKRRNELAARRAMLIARSQRQREQVAIAGDSFAGALWPLDAAEAVIRRAAAHPYWLTGAVVALVIVVRPGRLLRAVAWSASAALTLRRIASPWLALTAKRPAVL
jgi:hypothetical protein